MSLLSIFVFILDSYLDSFAVLRKRALTLILATDETENGKSTIQRGVGTKRGPPSLDRTGRIDTRNDITQCWEFFGL